MSIFKFKKDETTEGLIKSTAKRLFFGEGKFNATTQEIANAAGVNRTLINYYFRSRDNLFKIIFEETMQKEHEKSMEIMDGEMSLREKIEWFIDDSIETALKYPYIEIYLATEYYKHKKLLKRKKGGEKFYLKQVREEIAKGNIDEIEPFQFMLNLASLVNFPTSMRPLIQEIMSIEDDEYERILKNRKQVILNLIFKKHPEI